MKKIKIQKKLNERICALQLVDRSDKQKIVFIKSLQYFEEEKGVLPLQKLNSIDPNASKLQLRFVSRPLRSIKCKPEG